LLCIGFAVSLSLRASFKVDVIRDRGVMSRLVPGGNVENVYRLQITNATESLQTYHISVSGLNKLFVASQKDFTVNAAETRMVAVNLQIPDGSIESGSHPILFQIEALGSDERITEKSIFYMSR
jgi:polyferredoxin